MDGALEIGAGAEVLDELERRAHDVERRDLENPRVIEIDDTLILVFLQQRLKHGAGLRSVFGEDVALADVVGALAAGQRRPVEGHMTDEVESVEVLAGFLNEWVQGEPFGFEFLDDGLLARCGVPPGKEIVEAGEAFLQRLPGEIAQAFGNQLAVLVEIFHALRENGGADAIHVDLPTFLAALLDGDVGRSAWNISTRT